jgi:ribose transport system ATP-binding protein
MVLAIEPDNHVPAQTALAPLLDAFSQAAEQNWAQYIANLADQSRSAFQQMLYATGVRSYLQTPLRTLDELVGVLHLDACQPQAFTADHADIIREVATLLVVAIREARLYEQTRQDAATKATLLQEINHRVKNNLSSIIGLLYAEQRHAGIHEQAIYQDIMKDLISRVQGMATVHQMLSAAEWAPLPLRDLAARVVHSALQSLPTSKHISVDVSPSPIYIIPVYTTSLALVINELATNTIKYALGGRDHANIAIRITPADNQICFEFSDDGPGYPEDVLQRRRQEVGLYLVRAIVRDELHGELDLRNDNGAVATIQFKTEAKEQDNG